MSYQVIARKWRPQTFEEVTGQEHITQTLRNALAHDRLHHAYLFSGARGVGKTTTARLLAKALNCHKTDKPNLSPCRTDDPTACPSCVEISESRSMDVLEFDAASNTQVDKIREIILQNINIAPARDRYKVFIIDEVHMLSPSSFNALLKTVEEPPDDVVFIMATTELHKVPETIRSRCQEFDFRTIPLQKIFDRLKLIAQAEKIDVDDASLRQIARSGMGSMRDAQSNFDQVISFSGEKISIADVTNALGIASAEMLTRVIAAISDRKPSVVLDVVAELTSRGQDARNFCRDLLGLFRDLMVFKVSNGDTGLVENSALNPEDLNDYSSRFTEADFIRFFNSLCETETKLKEAVQPRYVLETGLVKLTEMRRVVAVEQLLERLTQLENMLSNGGLANLPASDAAAATAEKKTLNSEPAIRKEIVEPDESFPQEPEYFSPDPYIERELSSNIEPPAEVEVQLAPTMPTSQPIIDLGFLDSLPVKLAPIESEALEHVEDTWLDAAYDRKLELTGDDLFPIQGASDLAESLFGKQPISNVSASASNGSAASAAAPAFSSVYAAPHLDEEEVPEPVAPPANATEEELMTYAANHPLARKAMRIFRAKLVSAKRV
jgi:DNA polymerase-3 subunit gamma/tau